MRLRDALAKLPKEQQILLTRAYIDGMAYREIAAALGIPVNTVKSRVRLAAAKLRELIPR